MISFGYLLPAYDRAAREMSVNVGLVGLGHLGASVGINLLKAGYRLTVHDVQEEKAIPFLSQGAGWADSPKEVGEQAQAIITVLPSPAAVAAVI